MRKVDLWVHSLLVLITLLADQLTKRWVVAELNGPVFWNSFGLVLHRNPGAMLGMFSDLPPILRVVSLSTAGAFLVFVYWAVQYLLPRRSFVLRAGMSLLLGGILGNVTDRIIWGSVVDFLVVRWNGQLSPAFNIADAVQWVGYVLVVGYLLRYSQEIWPTHNERKQIWILPQFQLKFCLMLVATGFAYALIAGVYSYTFLRVTIEDLVPYSYQRIEQKFLIPFLAVFLIVAVGYLILLFIIGRLLSHRVAGPLYAFEKFVEDVLKGHDRQFKLRAGDDLVHLEEVAERLRQTLKPWMLEQKKATRIADMPQGTQLELADYVSSIEDVEPPRLKAAGESE